TDIYTKYYQQLIDAKVAYKCFCSDASLKMVRKRQLANGEPPRYSGTCRSLSQEEILSKEAAGEEAVLRFKVDPAAEIKFTDKVKGEQKFLGKNIGDFVIRKSGGDASFMFANAVDDALMGVDLVVRGDDHLSNTAYQLMILQQLNLPLPEYAHISLITGSDGAPLSKRNGSASIRDLLIDFSKIRREDLITVDGSNALTDKINGGLHKSCFPIAILNALARLGCAYESEELMDMPGLATAFDPDKLSRSPARYDRQQLKHWQALAMHDVSKEVVAGGKLADYADDLLKYVEFIIVSDGRDGVDATQFVRTFKDNVYCLKDLRDWALLLYTANINQGKIMGAEETDKKFYEDFAEIIKNSPDGSIDELRDSWKDITKELQEKTGRKGKQLFLPLRIALTGITYGPPLDEFYALIGKEDASYRLNGMAKITIST
ncbi:MAG: hypothetical protein HAW61_02205, partial [Candidatus Portiera sp.]|nr:hypothetical protein [Portiera sp.]